MNFKIYDDEFNDNKKEYLSEISRLKTLALPKEKIDEWDKFVNKTLVDTRSYYILVFSLNVMINLNNRNKFLGNEKDFYNSCLLKAMTFLPDKTFIETSIMIIEKYHRLGKCLAQSQGVDTLELYKQLKDVKK